MITPYNPPKPNRTAGDKLRAFANKLNEGNKLGICSLLLVAGLAVTLAVMSQEPQKLSKEKVIEIRTDFQNTQIGKKKILLKPKLEEVSQEKQPAWEYVKSVAIETTDTHIRTLGVIHSVDTGEANPHAVITVIQAVSQPTMMIVPKDICTEEGWNIILKAKPNPEFGTKWGFKVPDALGVGTTPGSDKPVEDPQAQPTAPLVPVIAKPTMPVERTITDTQGRALEGTILSKTDTSISFQRKGNGTPVDIKLDMLSPEDQAFVATLVDKKSAKPTVLFVTSQTYEESQELRTWLSNSGFEVTFGFLGKTSVDNTRKNLKIPIEEKAVLINQPTVSDQFDVVWMHRFDPEEKNGHPSLVNHRNNQKELIVIPTHTRLAKSDRFLSEEKYYAGSPMLGKEDKAYVKVEKHFIFCSNKSPHSTDEKMREKLLEAMKAELAK